MKSVQTLLIVALFVSIFAAVSVWMLPGAPQISLTNVRATPMAGADGRFHVFMSIKNTGGPDTLMKVSADEPVAAMMVNPEGQPAFPIPAGMTPQLASDGAHIMLSGVSKSAEEGALIPLRLTFAEAGVLSTKARVTAAGTGHSMMDGQGEVPPQQPTEPPLALSLAVTPIGQTGKWRLELALQGLALKEVPDGTPSVPGEGHGHLYIDGLKIQRLYAASVEIGRLPPGQHLFRVTLNGHDHKPLAGPDGLATTTAEVIIE